MPPMIFHIGPQLFHEELLQEYFNSSRKTSCRKISALAERPQLGQEDLWQEDLSSCRKTSGRKTSALPGRPREALAGRPQLFQKDLLQEDLTSCRKTSSPEVTSPLTGRPLHPRIQEDTSFLFGRQDRRGSRKIPRITEKISSEILDAGEYSSRYAPSHSINTSPVPHWKNSGWQPHLSTKAQFRTVICSEICHLLCLGIFHLDLLRNLLYCGPARESIISAREYAPEEASPIYQCRRPDQTTRAPDYQSSRRPELQTSRSPRGQTSIAPDDQSSRPSDLQISPSSSPEARPPELQTTRAPDDQAPNFQISRSPDLTSRGGISSSA
ncbi:formin-like protein 1 [Dorcoceras hygrometricum]|uniref:Formin-like protein 1 n=1 Tax=Dorcoceras hygrometricum TaxID=472368 RepID=A0A2Z7AKY8_9LAMI|nr:formin-like protein 1 [Dorcoceras hygrometricum]